MKNLKVNLFSVFVPVMEVIIAFLLITSPTGLMRGIVTTIGLCLIICGVGNIFRYFKADARTAALQQNLAKGIVQAVAGLILGVWSEAVIGIFPAMTVVFGIGLLIAGVMKIQRVADIIRLKKNWYLEGVSALLLFLFGILAIVNPFGTVTFVWGVIAAGLFLDAVLSIASLILVAKSENRTSDR